MNEINHWGCVPIHGLRPPKGAAYAGVAFVGREGHTEGRASRSGLQRFSGLRNKPLPPLTLRDHPLQPAGEEEARLLVVTSISLTLNG